MEYSKIDTGHMRNDMHFQFHKDIGKAIGECDPEAMRIKPQFEAYSACHGREDDALKKVIASALTQPIQDMDKARDETLSGMSDTVRAASKHPAPAKKEAARKIGIVLKTYGNVAQKTLNEETSAIHNLVQDLESPRYAADVAEIGIGFWLEELKARNNAFIGLMHERYDETAGRCPIVLKDARKETDKTYRHILKCMEVFASSGGESGYEAFASKHNAIVAKYKAMIRHSGGTASQGSEPEDYNT